MCRNSYGGTYKIDSFGNVHIDRIITTLVGCLDSTKYWQCLDSMYAATAIQLDEPHLYLYLNHNSERLVYVRKD